MEVSRARLLARHVTWLFLREAARVARSISSRLGGSPRRLVVVVVSSTGRTIRATREFFFRSGPIAGIPRGCSLP